MCFRTYDPATAVTFQRTADRYGIFHNFARVAVAGFPTSEALYQSKKFEHVRIIDEIRAAASPNDAKRIAYAHRGLWRHDWEQCKITAMRETLAAKAQASQPFANLLAGTGDTPIVEISSFDQLWGCKPIDGQLIGHNLLGRLLMELRAG